MILGDRKKFILKAVFIVIILSSTGTYAYFKTRDILLGPTITLSSPENGTTLEKSTIAVKGTAKNVSYLFLDDRPIFIDEQGNFSESVALLPGYNIISVKGEDRFGKKEEKIVQVVLKE